MVDSPNPQHSLHTFYGMVDTCGLQVYKHASIGGTEFSAHVSSPCRVKQNNLLTFLCRYSAGLFRCQFGGEIKIRMICSCPGLLHDSIQFLLGENVRYDSRMLKQLSTRPICLMASPRVAHIVFGIRTTRQQPCCVCPTLMLVSHDMFGSVFSEMFFPENLSIKKI